MRSRRSTERHVGRLNAELERHTEEVLAPALLLATCGGISAAALLVAFQEHDRLLAACERARLSSAQHEEDV